MTSKVWGKANRPAQRPPENEAHVQLLAYAKKLTTRVVKPFDIHTRGPVVCGPVTRPRRPTEKEPKEKKTQPVADKTKHEAKHNEIILGTRLEENIENLKLEEYRLLFERSVQEYLMPEEE